jgi:hypothetical protein
VTWRELTSRHFVLWTNAGRWKARRTLLRLERLRSALLEHFREWIPGGEPKGERLEVVLVATAEDYRAFGGPAGSLGCFASGTSGLEITRKLALMSLWPSARQRRVVLHELAHYFIDRYLPGGPPWLNEGLASYYETLREDPVGTVAGRRAFVYDGRSSAEIPPLEELFAMGQGALSAAPMRYHAAAWALVHLLSSPARKDRFQAFLALLRGEETPARAWTAVFGEVDLGSLHRHLRGYVLWGKLSTVRYPRAPASSSAEISPKASGSRRRQSASSRGAGAAGIHWHAAASSPATSPGGARPAPRGEPRPDGGMRRAPRRGAPPLSASRSCGRYFEGSSNPLKRSRSTFLSNLPTLVLGMASRKTMASGSDHLAKRSERSA